MTAHERVKTTSVRGVTLHSLTLADDARGRLTAGEFDRDVPFTPKRYFLVFDVPGGERRGEHAHRHCQQFLVCLRGSVTLLVDDGRSSEEIDLRQPDLGVYVPPMIWAAQFRYSDDAMLLVFASEHYDPADYIRDYDEFRTVVAS